MGETISMLIESEIQACVGTHKTVNKKIITIENHEQNVCKQIIRAIIKDQSLAIDEHDAELVEWLKKVSEFEIQLEGQEQYSRRTSLRFHNINVPFNERSRIIDPVNTDLYWI